jgi:large subunit ribosomal protein L6
MSRIGKIPVSVPSSVKVVLESNVLEVSGPNGHLKQRFPAEVVLNIGSDSIVVGARDEEQKSRAMWGLSRTLIANMVKGVSEGWSKDLEIVGVGYKSSFSNGVLILSLGYSHDIFYAIPQSIKVKCNTPTSITISGYDKQLVGQVAAEIRQLRKPEPYKGKGIKYSGEKIRRKEGKKK